jgi:hypothetical protein
VTQAEAAREIRDVLAGRTGGVNRVVRRFGKPIVDYATALLPDRAEPFERMVEDILVDVISQCRASARSRSDDEVFEFVIEAAMRTVRSRYPDVLAGEARPDKATRSYNFKEVMERTKMTEAEITAGISEGRIRAIRANDQLKIRGDSIPGLGDRKAYLTYNVTAADREILVLHYRMGFSPEPIARWLGLTPVQVEEAIAKASNRLASGMARRTTPGPGRQDTEMRRYIDGRMNNDETSKFERGIIKDKIAQQRLDELRTQSDSIKELFTSAPYDLSSIAVNVRGRNPHHSLALPPVAALWLQVVCIAGLMLMFHSVGAYLAPPTVHVSVVEGRMDLPDDGRLIVGEGVQTPAGAQALVVLDQSNRVLMAPGTSVKLLEPRNEARQVLGVQKGEIWGRFTSAGHAFLIEFPVAENRVFEIRSDDGADFDLVVGPEAVHVLPDNLERERLRAFAAIFEPADGGLLSPENLHIAADLRFGGGPEDDALKTGDVVESIGGVNLRTRDDLAEAIRALQIGEILQVTVRRGENRIALPLTRVESKPGAVLRVFHGSITSGLPGGDRVLINSGQWAVFTDGQRPLVGLRGMEDYRVLRIGSNELFKDRLHWLKTDNYPLRAENSLLKVNRSLRELAQKLEKMRADEILRDGPREIAAFETIMREAIEDAQDRLKRDEGREKGEGSASLSDRALVESESEILGVIEHWRRQSATGVYPTLGSAAKTLSSPVARFRDELEDRGEELTRSTLMQESIAKLDVSIGLQDEAIAELRNSEFFDADGSERKTIDDAIAELQKQVRAGTDARSRIDLLTIKLNDLDQRIDAQKRKLPNLRKAVDEAQAALNETNALLAANIYTAEKLADTEKKQKEAADALAAATTTLDGLKADLAKAQQALTDAEKALSDARKPLAGLQGARDTADEAFADAVTARATAKVEWEAADTEYRRVKAELDAMPADDPNRAVKEAEVATAEKAVNDTLDTLNQASDVADNAKADADRAAIALEDAEKVANTKKGELDTATAAAKTAQTRHDEQVKTKQAADETLKTADATLNAQQDAKTARALLDQRRADAETSLGTAQANLKVIEDAVAALEKEAQPERDKLTSELAIVDKAETAKKAIDERKLERGRYQGISDEIDLRGKDRQVLIDERDQLANSNLVLNFKQLSDEYQALSRRIDAYEFVRARGMLEDASFAHEQKAAQDRFREAALEAGVSAVTLLDAYCPAYDADAYRKWFDKDPALRPAVLQALWKLYYDAGLDGSDAESNICYYVIVQSGAGNDALDKLDNRWKAYLTAALGTEGFAAITELKAEDLQAGKKD